MNTRILRAGALSATLCFTACAGIGGDSDEGQLLIGALPAAASVPGVGGSDTDPTAASATIIRAADGGIVSFGSRVELVIPPGSLAEDTEISVEALNADDTPAGESDGFAEFGQAYRFLPAGTQFDPNKPATLRMKYDSQDLADAGLSSSTMQLYYFNESLEQYVAVDSEVNTSTGQISARVEHFTIYLPLAKSMVPGNNLPAAAVLDPRPRDIRAGAPVYIRATASDFDLGGAIAGVRICIRKLNPVPAPGYDCRPMQRETRDDVLNTYGYLLNSNDSYALAAGDPGPGNDIEFYAEATDNLGATAISTVRAYDVDRTINPATLSLNVTTQNMTAGSRRIFLAEAFDDQGDLFRFVPDSASVNGGIGSVLRTEYDGVLFQAEQTAVGDLEIAVGAQTAQANISVFNGPVDRIAVLDQNSQPITGTVQVKEGHAVSFDVVGYDAFDNIIPVLASWTSDANLGLPITSDGLLDTLGGSGFGQVIATLADLTGVQWLQILARSWSTIGTFSCPVAPCGAEDIEFSGSTPYVSGVFGGEIFVFRYENGAWPVLGSGAANAAPTNVRRANMAISDSGIVHILDVRDTGHHIVRRFQAGVWQDLGGSPLSGLPEELVPNASDVDIAVTNGNTPVVALSAATSTAVTDAKIYVLEYTGVGSTGWSTIGGQVSDAGGPAIDPRLTVQNGTIYVSYSQDQGSDVSEVFVKRWSGSAWVSVGSSSFPGVTSSQPTPSLTGTATGDLYLAYRSAANAFVAWHWNGTNWTQLGSNLLDDPGDLGGNISIALITGRPYVAWNEFAGGQSHVNLAHWTGSAWEVQPQAASSAGTDRLRLTGAGFTPWLLYRQQASLPFDLIVSILD